MNFLLCRSLATPKSILPHWESMAGKGKRGHHGGEEEQEARIEPGGELQAMMRLLIENNRMAEAERRAERIEAEKREEEREIRRIEAKIARKRDEAQSIRRVGEAEGRGSQSG